MMVVFWTVLIIAITIAESTNSNLQHEQLNDIPLSKSLGFSIRKDFGKTLDDARADQNYLKLYSEMLKDSQDVGYRFEKDYEVDTDDLTRIQGKLHRRRAHRMLSPVHLRQARSQAHRREKLYSQSLRSHLEYSSSPLSSSEE